MVSKYSKILVLSCLIGASVASRSYSKEHLTSGNKNFKRSPGYGTGLLGKEHNVVIGASVSVPTGQHFYQLPTRYSNSIPAAAIRNVETIVVTKTITPIVTKTTTHKTHSEPALSIGHVQGYSKSAIGQPKFAPVQYTTQYTSYGNPTVGVNGPVSYTGPAVIVGGGGSGGLPVVSGSIGGSYGGVLAGSYGAPYAAPLVSYGSYSSPEGVYSHLKGQTASIPLTVGSAFEGLNGHGNHYQVPQGPAVSYGVPRTQHGSHSMNLLTYMKPPGPEPAASFHQPQYFYAGNQERHQQRSPVQTFVETYASPSITITQYIPIKREPNSKQ